MSMHKEHHIFDGVEIGVGTWAWGDRLVWGFGNGYSEKEVREAFLTSIRGGIRFFDTAEVYGQGKSESILGELIQETDEPVIIATKMMPFPWRVFKGSMRVALKNSLKRLKQSSIALYQMHVQIPPLRPQTWMKRMLEMHEIGLIDAIGVSNYNLAQTVEAHEALKKHGLRLASNQVEYHLLDRHIERDGLRDYCLEEGIKLIAYSPLAMGVLTGKYTAANPLRGTRGARYGREFLAGLQPMLNSMARIGNEHNGKTTAQVALNWVVQKQALPIPGAKDAHQAEQNLGAVGWKLTDDEISMLDEMSLKVQKTGIL